MSILKLRNNLIKKLSNLNVDIKEEEFSEKVKNISFLDLIKILLGKIKEEEDKEMDFYDVILDNFHMIQH